MYELLDPSETHHSIPSKLSGMSLFLRKLSRTGDQARRGTVLYVHGATFPSALSVAFRFGGTSWRDALCKSGFDVWALDFLGFGYSDRYAEMKLPENASPPLCGAVDAAGQLLSALRYIVAVDEIENVSIVAHSWGSMPTCRVAIEHPNIIDRIVLFAPIASRTPIPVPGAVATPPAAWRVVTIEEQHERFVEDLPADAAPVLLESEFGNWSDSYLRSDLDSKDREPASVKVPAGPTFEIAEAWRARLQYEPGLLTRPVAIIRGAWDSLVTDADARWLFDAFTHAPEKRDIKISSGTHLMHLESGRTALYEETNAFLLAMNALHRSRPFTI